MPTQIRPPAKRWPFVVALILLGLFGAFAVLSEFFIDLLWFQEVGFTSVFWGTFWAKVALGAAGAILFFLLLYGNLLLVRRMAPTYRVLSPDQQAIEPIRRAVAPYLWWLLPLVSLILAVVVGIGASKGWVTFLLWRNSDGLSFDMQDPIFHRDAAYYVFSLPFWQAVQSWIFGALIGVTVLVAMAHVFFGGIRPQAPRDRVSPLVKGHLSVLLGLIVLTTAWGFVLDRYDLLLSERGVVDGASYTDVHAQLPAYGILAVVAVFCAILFLINIRMRGWALPVIGIALLGVTFLLVGTVIPAAVQKFSVEPQELQREMPYIEDNIRFTREAFGLDAVDAIAATPRPDIESEAIARNRATVDNIRLWDPEPLRENYEQLQRIKPYYEFSDVDVDRYVLGGEIRMVMPSPREVSQDGIPGDGGTWQNKHLVYTHGYGAAASLVNGAGDQGGPLFVLRDLPPTGEPPELAAELNGPDGQPRVYYGERADVEYVVANTKSGELDYQGTPTDDSKQITSHYEGTGGIPTGGFIRKALFAWKYKDLNLLISDLITPESRIMLYRTIQDRVPKAAPFLRLDGDPYSAIVDGRIVWIWDAYTATDRFPYSEAVDLATATHDATMKGKVNYIRNSVKVVVDAYDGTMTYYIVDPSDPIVQAWAAAFPDLFTSQDEVPGSLRAHFRYPENLLQIEATQYANYHVTDPAVFYQKQDFWAIPGDPAQGRNEGRSAEDQLTTMRPYYVLTKLPGQESEEFALIIPFVPQQRQNMVAWMAARSDPEHYGELVSYEFPSDTTIEGPVNVFNRINAFPDFSEQATLLGQSGSTLRFGSLLAIPIEGAFLYVQPVFVQSSQADSFPELRLVLVVHGESIGMGATIDEALVNSGLASEKEAIAEPGAPDEPAGPSRDGAGEVDRLLDQAVKHFEAADDALRAGDLATYQEEIATAEELVRDAVSASVRFPNDGASNVQPSPASPPTPTPLPTLSPAAAP